MAYNFCKFQIVTKITKIIEKRKPENGKRKKQLVPQLIEMTTFIYIINDFSVSLLCFIRSANV